MIPKNGSRLSEKIKLKQKVARRAANVLVAKQSNSRDK
jgi:hypothetical protein